MVKKREANLFPGRQLTVCYWNVDPRVVDLDLMLLERQLKRLAEVELRTIKDLSDAASVKVDLFIIAAQMVPQDEFATWLAALRQKIGMSAGVWIPALLLSDIDFGKVEGILTQVAAENWYFDIISKDHLSSLPIRVANLLRIHDHLHELLRYNEAINSLQDQVNGLKSSLESLPKPGAGQ